MIDGFAAFTLVSDPILLETDGGSADCFPFAEAVGPLESYPESNNDQCVRPENNSEGSVCAVQYTSAVDPTDLCSDRNYTLATYPSQEEAESAGAVVTHGGGKYHDSMVVMFSIASLTFVLLQLAASVAISATWP